MNRPIDGFKICPQCNENKSLKNDYYRGGSKGGKVINMSWCKSCCKRLRPQNKEYFKQYYQKNKERRQSQERYRRYGITSEDFNKFFESQGRCCVICKSIDHKGKGWAVDHDHNPKLFGKVRGILCNLCNQMLGCARDNPDILVRASQYLEVQYVAY